MAKVVGDRFGRNQGNDRAECGDADEMLIECPQLLRNRSREEKRGTYRWDPANRSEKKQTKTPREKLKQSLVIKPSERSRYPTNGTDTATAHCYLLLLLFHNTNRSPVFSLVCTCMDRSWSTSWDSLGMAPSHHHTTVLLNLPQDSG